MSPIPSKELFIKVPPPTDSCMVRIDRVKQYPELLKLFSTLSESTLINLLRHPTRDGLFRRPTRFRKKLLKNSLCIYLPKTAIKQVTRIKGGIYDSIILTNGSKISFKSSDSGVRNFAGAEKRWIWFDEEPPKDVYNECLARIGSGHPLDIWLTMTPIFEQRGSGRKIGMSWTYRDLYAQRDDKRIFCVGVGIEDNPHLTKEQIEEQKKKYHGAEYDIRIKGEFRLLSGSLVFDGLSIEDYLTRAIEPTSRGDLSIEPGKQKPSLSPDSTGSLSIWEKPLGTSRYFIGADCGLGQGGDPSCAVVLDHKLKQVAELHGQIPPDKFGEALIKLGTYYLNAWIGVEANSFGIACLDAMKKKYRQLYFQYTSDERTDHQTKKIGWWTTAKTKPIMISDFGEALRERSIKLPSRPLCEELTTYVIDDSGSANAELGCHDDRIIAACIALQVRKRKLYAGLSRPVPPPPTVNPITGY